MVTRRSSLPVLLSLPLLLVPGCNGRTAEDRSNNTPAGVVGETHSGQYHLGPVEWEGSFTNACGPYVDDIEALQGTFLVGLSNEVAGSGNLCDAPVELRTGLGHTVVGRAITYGVSNEAGDADVSQALFDAVNEGEFPRSMEWQLVRLADAGPLTLQFQTGSHVDWTSFWVRNPAVAIAKVEVRSERHDFTELRRQTDGTFNDDGGFGAGAFTIRVTGIDASVAEASFPGFGAGALLAFPQNL